MGDPQVPDPYEAVIADLERQIAQLQAAIQTIKAIRSGTVIPPMPTATAASGNGTGVQQETSAINIAIDEFHKLTVAQAIKKYLAMRPRRPATTQEIVDALKSGGQSGADGANFSVVVNNSLNRMAADDGAVTKVRKGIWGLKEWYSGKATE